MSKRGENIYKRKDGRWEGRYVRKRDPAGKAKLGYVYAKTYREVKEKLHAAKSGIPVSTETTSRQFSVYCDEWLILHRNRVKESTYVKYHAIMNKHIKPALGSLSALQINTVVVENFSNGLLTEKKLSAKTVKDILMVLRSVLQHTRKVTTSSCPDTEVLYPKETRREMRVLSREEQKQFAAFLLTDIDTIKFGILLALLTGMRIGEICALRWGDILLEEEEIHISATMQRIQVLDSNAENKTKVILGDAKSSTSCRKIPLTDTALSLCRKMYIRNTAAFILTGQADRYLEPRALQYRFKKYTNACGLSDVHFHSLRHTFATRCVEVGFEIKSLSEILGHASAKVTLDRYVHSSMELKRQNMQKLAAAGL